MINEPLFRKILSLKKILKSYDKKTYSLQKQGKEISLINRIKLEICIIFERILDTKEDYLINNFITYIRVKFMNKD